MEIDLIPLAQLPSRYGIARSNLYTRLKDLKIESVKQGRKAFVSGDNLRLLDGLHAHLEKGGTTNEFIKEISSNSNLENVSTADVSAYDSRDTSNGGEGMVSLQPSVLVGAIEAVVKRLIPTNRSSLNYLRDLEEAYEKGWLLSTSEISKFAWTESKNNNWIWRRI